MTVGSDIFAAREKVVSANYALEKYDFYHGIHGTHEKRAKIFSYSVSLRVFRGYIPKILSFH